MRLALIEQHLEAWKKMAKKKVVGMVPCERCSLFLADYTHRELVFKPAEANSPWVRLPMTKGITGHVATTGESLMISDAYQDARFNPEMDRKTGFRTKSVLCCPVRLTARGGIVGCVQLLNRLDQEGGFSEQDLHILQLHGARLGGFDEESLEDFLQQSRGGGFGGFGGGIDLGAGGGGGGRGVARGRRGSSSSSCRDDTTTSTAATRARHRPKPTARGEQQQTDIKAEIAVLDLAQKQAERHHAQLARKFPKLLDRRR